ncbi:DUF3336 domain-containing protein [Pseudomaricurvus alkylphenolicus]|jgi:NTE family protein|uniref:DUF3336 domain-containing protein n=1 Tax=Pseudomaricurvus alkylphenolicus TaxID=1306991 RepID=UPI001422178B|nr:DUF3336 domain-containing protein [Pseudomaricurvus alkylphenolicus]NIB41676.1 DUF3336 domain-containing protein [Pseudomaricurvus alkylphenolicus]
MLVSTTRKFEKAMAAATTYDEWRDAALAFDKKQGLDRWKAMDQSRRYDYVSIRTRLDRLRVMRARHDDQGLLFTLNEGIHGNMGGMGSSKLYLKAKFGTKQLVVDYVNEIVDALEHLADDKTDSIPFEQKLDFFRRAHHCFGSSAFMMSGSGTLLYFHMGVVRTLLDHDLLPNVLSGSSGGSLVGSIVSCYPKDKLQEMLSVETMLNAYERDEERGGVLGNLLNEIMPRQMGAEAVRETISRILPDLTFQEAFELTGRHLNVSIAPVETHQTSRLLNAFTSPNVFVREAIFASTAVPGVYPPVTLAAKNDHGERQAYLPSRQWVDGSVSDDLPAKRLARLYGVNHYIVSQTNPHVIPFVTDSKREGGPMSQIKYAGMQTARTWLNTSAEIMRKPMSRSPALSRLSNMALSVVNQDYIGDINILPSTKFFNPAKLLSQLNEKDVRKLVLMGERATWPKLEMIRVQTLIGRTLDRILSEYEDRYLEKYQPCKKAAES